ncbi:peptidoglycan DD-metalloendopeptidase family protein [Maritimibacter sp. DP1N21-5]|uniref:peptidoglycan DD-metalloendopeptidase family protein n=1 Tax=Maritimibacter sp. DP1N21-5 TaxID=2836867 RepID=UPI001C47BB15|nr:peptidoglycan DD-metalloendopeptidase family protein [Maritimibacter sp. DP1N21-5]MBV7410027.1 peptidoglycan DD-metalloendopeptidase family protein [Maritimibacter sp. DP1N21-5]
MDFRRIGWTTAGRFGIAGVSLLALAACESGIENFDPDLRRFGPGFSTAEAAQSAAASRPTPDARGVISYPNYQVAVARSGDTMTTLSQRIGLPESELARFNGLSDGAPLREGEIIALPRRVAESGGGSGAVDVTTIAGQALDRVGSGSGGSQATMVQATPSAPTGNEPTRHQVVRGETAYSIARLYGVSVRSLAEWNSLDASLTVRDGQYLLIPTGGNARVAAASVDTSSQPGAGSAAPLPPSSASPLPPAAATTTSTIEATPASPEMAGSRTQSAAMAMPVAGSIVGAYVKGKSDGIDISAPAGTPVKAAQSGTVAAITRDTDNVPILVLRHEGSLLTVYAGIDNITVAKGATVSQGQAIAQVRKAENPTLHFQVRQGTASVDPMKYLN